MPEWRGQDSNLRPRGYEPRELPGCSTPRHFRIRLSGRSIVSDHDLRSSHQITDSQPSVFPIGRRASTHNQLAAVKKKIPANTGNTASQPLIRTTSGTSSGQITAPTHPAVFWTPNTTPACSLPTPGQAQGQQRIYDGGQARQQAPHHHDARQDEPQSHPVAKTPHRDLHHRVAQHEAGQHPRLAIADADLALQLLDHVGYHHAVQVSDHRSSREQHGHDPANTCRPIDRWISLLGCHRSLDIRTRRFSASAETECNPGCWSSR